MVTRPWPGMLRTIYGDPERYNQQYWSQMPGIYFTGDGARRDADGYFWVMGRIDDVLNVAGHRLGTIEIESALVSHPAVAEAAVVGRPDELKGEAVAVFVSLERASTADELKKALKDHVAKEIGAFAAPTTSASPTRCRRPAAARSCAACCATSPPAGRPSATPRRSRTTPCSRSCGRTRNSPP